MFTDDISVGDYVRVTMQLGRSNSSSFIEKALMRNESLTQVHMGKIIESEKDYVDVQYYSDIDVGVRYNRKNGRRVDGSRWHLISVDKIDEVQYRLMKEV